MEHDTKTPQWNNGDKHSFAWTSARRRWPVIITQAIDDVHRTVAETSVATDAEKLQEGKDLIAKFATLKYELQHDRKMTQLLDDGYPDITGYNNELEERKNLSWLSAPWLFSECYLYRRMHTYIRNSQHWKSYDIFARSKTTGFKSSRVAVLELAAQYKQIITKLEQTHQSKDSQVGAYHSEPEEVLFIEMCEICLWGNKTDLSLLPTMDHDQIQKLQGSKVRKAAEKNILVNDIPKAFKALEAKRQSKGEIRVDIVLDNAGFELFVDLILAGYLLAAGLATTVILHPKTIPWFVSDVTPSDFGQLLKALQSAKSYFADGSNGNGPLTESELDSLRFLFEHWTTLHIEGKLIVRPNDFWTEGGSFWRLPVTAPDLYEDLKESELIIFKGDLNYRKLTADAMWSADTPFEEALGPLGAKSGLRILSLRTCKADVVVGLSPGKDQELRANQGGDDPEAREWAWGGEWAVCQFYDGRL